VIDIPQVVIFHPKHWPEETWKIVRTATALSSDGKSCDCVELIDAIMADYGWSEEEAEDHIDYAEYLGAISPAPGLGEMVQ
jgi:hypothetical protein